MAAAAPFIIGGMVATRPKNGQQSNTIALPSISAAPTPVAPTPMVASSRSVNANISSILDPGETKRRNKIKMAEDFSLFNLNSGTGSSNTLNTNLLGQ